MEDKKIGYITNTRRMSSLSAFMIDYMQSDKKLKKSRHITNGQRISSFSAFYYMQSDKKVWDMCSLKK